MREPWDLSPTTGDQCALCADLLDDTATTVELDNGRLLHVCGACAADRAGDAAVDTHADPAASPEARVSAGEEGLSAQARSLVSDMIDARAREHSSLRDLARLVDRLDEELARAQMSTLGLEERVRALEIELERAREQARRAESLLAAARPAGTSTSAAEEERVAAHFPEPAPDLIVSVNELTGEDVRISQRLFNESPFIEKTRSVRRSLGRPIVNLARVTGEDRKTLLTAAWDIVWYQYLLDLEAGPEEPAVTLFAEGMELSELSPPFKEANGMIDDNGRFDASELELSLERDHPAHAAARDDEDDQAMDDATEEIWGKTSMPEFRWDD